MHILFSHSLPVEPCFRIADTKQETCAAAAFCFSHVGCAGLSEKEGSLERMGMEGIISDMRAGKQRLQAKYLEAYAAAQHHFADVAAVRTAVQAACSPLEQAQCASSHKM